MADTKISNLPAVVAPVGTDEFACNQAGTTKKETKTQITAATDAALAADVANLAAHIAVTTAPIHGSSAAAGANTLAHRNAAGDLAATDFNAVAGTAADPSHTFTANPDTGLYRFAANELGIATAGVHRAHWNTTGAVILNDAAASTKMTGPGVTIQQGAFDDEAVALQSSDVAHGMTTVADTDTYALIRKVEAASGGAQLRGVKDADGIAGLAIQLWGGLGMDADTTKTPAGRAIVEVYGVIRDVGTPTQIGNTNADGNVFAVLTRRGGADVALLIVDEDADLHVLNDVVVAGVVDTIDVANHVHTAAAGMGPQLTAAGITDRTRKFFVPVVAGYDMTGAPSVIDIFTPKGIQFIDNQLSEAFGYAMVPSDFASGMTITPVIVPDLNGNCYGRTTVYSGQCAEAYNIHTDTSDGFTAVAVTQDDNNCIHQVTLANEAVGDILRCLYERDAVNVLDTIGLSVYVAGFIVEYTADS